MLNIQVFPVNMVEENTYVVSDDTHEAAIIDCGALYAEEREAILEYVRSRQLRVTCLLNTHGHFDHVLGCQWASDTFGVGVEIHIDELENYQRSASDMVAFLRRGVPFDLPTPVRLLEGGDTVQVGEHEFRVISTPGHTPGGCCFYCAEEKVLFAGDSLFRANIGRCDLPGGNLESLITSLRARVLTLPDDVVVYSGHGEPTTIGFERVHNPYL